MGNKIHAESGIEDQRDYALCGQYIGPKQKGGDVTCKRCLKILEKNKIS